MCDPETKISTEGGAVIRGNIRAGGDFVGRDQTKVNGQIEMVSLVALTRLLDEIRNALERSTLDPNLVAMLKADIEVAHRHATSDRPLMPVIKAKLKSVQKAVKSLGDTAKSVETLLVLLGKAAKMVGLTPL